MTPGVSVSCSLPAHLRFHGHGGLAEGQCGACGGQRGGQPRHALPQGEGTAADGGSHPREEGREGEVQW